MTGTGVTGTGVTGTGVTGTGVTGTEVTETWVNETGMSGTRVTRTGVTGIGVTGTYPGIYPAIFTGSLMVHGDSTYPEEQVEHNENKLGELCCTSTHSVIYNHVL